MKKRIFALLLMTSLAIGLFASCSSGSVDEQFVKAFQKGLSARWSKAESMEDQDESKKFYDELINAELDKIGEFEDKDFEDKELGEAAKGYIKTLKETSEITKYCDTDYDKFYNKYNSLYSNRAEYMYKISQKADITFSNEDDKDSWETCIEEGKLYTQINELKSSLQFSLDKDDEWGDTTGTLVLENTLGVDFESFGWDISLYDANGVVLETAYAYAENWKQGQKTTFEFWTDVDFATYEISGFDFYEE